MNKNIKWTYDACREEALKYNTRSEYIKGNGGSYNASRKNGWLDDICKHMLLKKIPDNYWNYDRCKEEFKKYDNCTELKNSNNSCKCYAVKKGWYKELSSHFVKKGHKYKRFIYSCEFSDNSVYVGLTYNTTERFRNHLKEGSVYNHIEKSGNTPKFKILTERPVEVSKAVELEEYYLLKYQNEGWKTLNRAKTGSIGGNNLMWTFEAIKNEALKYKSRSEFENNSLSAYNTALRKKWMDEVCQHMSELKKPSGYWKIYENCKVEALKYKSVSEFQSKASAAYKSARRNNWMPSLCTHMEKIKKPNGYYTKEKCLEIAKGCESKKELKFKNQTVYNKLYKNKWMTEAEKFYKNEI